MRYFLTMPACQPGSLSIKKSRVTCGSPRQPGYLMFMRPVAFRPRLATGLALSGKQLTVVKKVFYFNASPFPLSEIFPLKISEFFGPASSSLRSMLNVPFI